MGIYLIAYDLSEQAYDNGIYDEFIKTLQGWVFNINSEKSVYFIYATNSKDIYKKLMPFFTGDDDRLIIARIRKRKDIRGWYEKKVVDWLDRQDENGRF